MSKVKKSSPHLKEFFGISPSAEFFYFEDRQSNIVELLDNSGSVVVKYRYDAWGKCVVDASTTKTTKYDIIHGEFR